MSILKFFITTDFVDALLCSVMIVTYATEFIR